MKLRQRIFQNWATALIASYSIIAVAAGINDTGQTVCYDDQINSPAPVACSTAVGGDTGVNPRQDGRYGRDAAAAAGQLTKVGAGVAGFDFAKISNDGNPLAPGAVLGANGADWACTRDNVTGLMWEVKTATGMRASAHTYAWYSTDSTSNGYTPPSPQVGAGSAGAEVGELGADTCGGTLAAAPYNNQCNTRYFVAAVNAVGLCGHTDWRLASRRELLSIVRAGTSAPSVDGAYFPNTANSFYWTASTSPGSWGQAFVVRFIGGEADVANKAQLRWRARLVRG